MASSFATIGPQVFSPTDVIWQPSPLHLTGSLAPSAPARTEESNEEEPRVPATLYTHYTLPHNFSSFLEQLEQPNLQHPIPLVETETLATIPLPELEPFDRIAETIPSGLSGPQLVSVLHADKAHRRWLPAGVPMPDDDVVQSGNCTHPGWVAQNAVRKQKERCGFWIADGTGVGKGRQCAGILACNMLKRRFLHVWFSPSRCLINDLRRDFDNIGGKDVVVADLRSILSFEQLKTHLETALKRAMTLRSVTKRPAPTPFGVVIFVTYSLMSQEKRSRLLTDLLVKYAEWEKTKVKELLHEHPYSAPSAAGVFSAFNILDSTPVSSSSIDASSGDELDIKTPTITIDDELDDDDELNEDDDVKVDVVEIKPESLTSSNRFLRKKETPGERGSSMTSGSSSSSSSMGSSSSSSSSSILRFNGKMYEQGGATAAARAKVICSIFDNELKKDIEEDVGFNGCIVFDESHKAKGLGIKGPATKIATTIRTLQERHYGARVVYASATGAVSLPDMAYLTRLGLWGPGSAFETFGSFSKALSRKGHNSTSMELSCMELKRSGVMCTRTLGFHETEFSIESVFLSEQDQTTYNQCVELWEMIIAIWPTGKAESTSTSSAAVQRYFWGAHQRFFLQLLLAMKIPSTAALARQEVENGRSVIISLISTGGSYVPGAEEEDDGEDPASDTVFQSALKEIVLGTLSWLSTHFPTIDTAPALQRLAEINLEINSLDQLIDLLGGPDAVSEITGRSVRTVRIDGSLRRVNRGTNETQKETRRFMTGKTNIVIISSAGSHGISLHSDRSCSNQRKRVHMMLQLPWSATVALQQFGRSHRSNQVTPPIYRLIVTPLGGEYRLASTIANQLRELGAVTSADRRATAHLSPIDKQYALIPLYADKAANNLCKALSAAASARPAAGVEAMPGSSHDLFAELLQPGSVIDITAGMKSYSCSAVYQAKSFPQFLNRILGLRIEDQARVFKHFISAYHDVVNRAKQDGSFDPGVSQLTGTKHAEEMWYEEGADKTVCTTLLRDRGISWERAEKMLLHHTNAEPDLQNGFYVTHSNHTVALFLKRPLTSNEKALRSQGQHTLRNFSALKPNGGPIELVPETEFFRWKAIELTQAKRLWEHTFRSSNHQQPAGRIQKCFIMSGLLLPIFSEIQSAAGARRIGVCRVRYLDSLEQQQSIDMEDDQPLLHATGDDEFFHASPFASSSSASSSSSSSSAARVSRTHCGLLLPSQEIANAVRRMLHSRQESKALEVERAAGRAMQQRMPMISAMPSKHIDTNSLLLANRALDNLQSHTMSGNVVPFTYDPHNLLGGGIPHFMFGQPLQRLPSHPALPEQLSGCVTCHHMYPLSQPSCPKCFRPRVSSASMAPPTYRSARSTKSPTVITAAAPRTTGTKVFVDLEQEATPRPQKQPQVISLLDEDDDEETDDVQILSRPSSGKRDQPFSEGTDVPEPQPKRHQPPQ